MPSEFQNLGRGEVVDDLDRDSFADRDDDKGNGSDATVDFRPSLGLSAFDPLGGPTPFTMFAGRSPFSLSPTKREEHRPSSSPMNLLAQTLTPAPYTDPQKRSNLLFLLNSVEEGPKLLKRENLLSAS